MAVLIEREQDVGTLCGLLTRIGEGGDGGAIVIEGDAGCGKTSLLAGAREAGGAAGLRVLAALADEEESHVPLAAVRVLLARAAAELLGRNDGWLDAGLARRGALAVTGEHGEPMAEQEVAHSIYWLVVALAEAQPLALVVDDAHWADELSLRCLRLLARRANGLPVALLIAGRPAAGAAPAYRALLAEREVARVEPAPLSAAATARLIERFFGRAGELEFVAAVRTCSRGNPLLLGELLHDLARRGVLPVDGSAATVAEIVPDSLARFAAVRLAGLRPAANAVCQACAVLGTDATAERVAGVADIDAAELPAARAELEELRILDGLAFLHPVLATAVRSGLPPPLAARLHERAAQTLRAEGAPVERVASHLVHAPPRGDPAVVDVLVRAAREAARVGAPGRAAECLRRALAEPPDAALRPEFERRLGSALLDAGDPAGEAILIGGLGSHADATEGLRRLVAHYGFAQRFGEAVRLVAEHPAADAETRLELLSEALYAGQADLEVRDRVPALLADARAAAGDTPAARLATAIVTATESTGASDTAERSARAAERLLAFGVHRDFPRSFAAGGIVIQAVAALINADHLDSAERATEALRTDARELSAMNLESGAVWTLAQIAFQRGDLVRAEAEARSCMAMPAGPAARRVVLPVLALTLTAAGGTDEAERLLADAGLLGQLADTTTLTTTVYGVRGSLRLAQGRFDDAAEDLRTAHERNIAFWGRARLEPPWRALLVEALVGAGDRDAAATEAKALQARAREWNSPRAIGVALRVRALTVPPADAVPAFAEACALLRRSHARLELARALAALGAARRRAGERAAARADLREAHDLAVRCGARPLCDAIRAELLVAGGRPRPASESGAHSLTASERRIAELAAAGASNREIAQRLYLSPKTIEMHLSHAYRKLGVDGRRGLAGAIDG